MALLKRMPGEQVQTRTMPGKPGEYSHLIKVYALSPPQICGMEPLFHKITYVFKNYNFNWGFEIWINKKTFFSVSIFVLCKCSQMSPLLKVKALQRNK